MTEQSPSPNPGDLPPEDVGLESGGPQVTKTPLFEANHADRYQRQALIRKIEERTKCSLICYVSGSECMIDANDTAPFVDLHSQCPADQQHRSATPYRRGCARRGRETNADDEEPCWRGFASHHRSRLRQECGYTHGARS